MQYGLVFVNNKYKILDAYGVVITTIPRFSESDSEYEERAIREFDKYIEYLRRFKKKITPIKIKTAYV